MKKQEKIAEGYHPMGKKASYNDNTPTVKMVIQHNREIQEGEQRYRNVARIFLENQLGERILAPTVKPGIASIYARHLAEGGLPHDDRWNHINSLCEEYQKMAGFVRATRNGQFNESAQKLVNEGINHYNSLRESLSKMRSHRGYNSYFESYTPPLMEDDNEETNLNELFVQETLDPRIESVMPILNKLQKKVAEMKEVDALSEWADSLLEGGDGGEASEETDVDTDSDAGEPGGEDAPPDDLSEGDGGQVALNPIGVPESEMSGGIDAILAQHPEAVEHFKQGGDMDYDLQSDLWDYYFNQGDIKNYDADASEYIGQQLADYLGIDEGMTEDLDADQKRVGQLGPTEKVKNNNIGKLVGANENFINTVDQAVVSEMDKSQTPPGRDGSNGDSDAGKKQYTAKSITAKQATKAAGDILNKAMSKEHKKDVKEGQEDLDAILRIIRK